MEVFQIVLGLMILGIFLTGVSGRIGVPGPVLLAVVGAAAACVPGLPEVRLDPELALTLFVAPMLMAAAYDTSLRDLRENWRPVVALVVNLVCVNVAAVAILAHFLLPDLPWAAAIALGAVVAPPDASAATSVLRRLSPPHRILVVLEGESLLNDASALLIFRVAVVWAAGTLPLAQAVPLYAIATVVGLAVGCGLGWAFVMLSRFGRNIENMVALQFITVFALWMLADRLGFSAILTVVAFGVTVGRLAPSRTPPEQRLTVNAVWEVANHVLTVLAFILTGLQLKTIIGRLGDEWWFYLGFAAAICGCVVFARVIWVGIWMAIVRLRARLRPAPAKSGRMKPPKLRGGVIVAWCGMRGVVTLATALALPETFPHRDLLVFAAFSVVLTTLVLQGGTMGLLLRMLDVADDGAVRQETALARAATARAALAGLGAPGSDSAAATALRADYKERLRQAESPAGDPFRQPGLARLRSELVREERRVLNELRDSARIGDAAYHLVEEELDWSEVAANRRLEPW